MPDTFMLIVITPRDIIIAITSSLIFARHAIAILYYYYDLHIIIMALCDHYSRRLFHYIFIII